jgi:hypothetical protein
MPDDMQQLELIKQQTLTRIAEITASPKPSYTIDHQSVSWADYLVRLQATVDWCERKAAGGQPFEIRSQGMS